MLPRFLPEENISPRGKRERAGKRAELGANHGDRAGELPLHVSRYTGKHCRMPARKERPCYFHFLDWRLVYAAQLDRLYARLACSLDKLLQAVGLKAA